MKDLRFFGTISGTEVDITFRTDLIIADSEFFNVSQISVGEQFELSDSSDEDHIRLFGDFKRLNYNLTEFKQFAETNNVNLTIAESDGSGLITFVEADESQS